jgi:hypothetical protein
MYRDVTATWLFRVRNRIGCELLECGRDLWRGKYKMDMEFWSVPQRFMSSKEGYQWQLSMLTI